MSRPAIKSGRAIGSAESISIEAAGIMHKLCQMVADVYQLLPLVSTRINKSMSDVSGALGLEVSHRDVGAM